MAVYTAAKAERLILAGNAPANMEVGGSLDLSGTQITALPDGLSVGGSLYLRGTQITALPDGLSVGGSLDLRGTQITALPDGLSVGGSLYLRGAPASAYPTKWYSIKGQATRWRILAADDEYCLQQSDTGQLVAGCRGPWTAKQALAHWDRPSRTDARAKLFTAAIKAHAVEAVAA